MSHRLSAGLISLLLTTTPLPVTAAELPILGESFTEYSSLEEEHRLGRAWVRLLRGNARLIDDPLLQDYLEALLYRLASHSELTDKRLTLALLNDASLNAFAVPGGVIGVNGGLFLHAEREDELGSVLAHELAHLSQRHYAQGLEEQQKQLPLQLATILSTLILAAASDGQQAPAAAAAGQAALAQQQLAYSRQHEQEADRIGMQTLYRANFSPDAMPRMFERMLRLTRFSGQRPPEFLLTHPVTESRVADAQSRASQLPDSRSEESDSYRIMRIRAQVAMIRSPRQLLEHFQARIAEDPSPANRYGLVMSAIAAGTPASVEQPLQELLDQAPSRIAYRVLQAEWLLASQRPEQAVPLLRQQLELSPSNRALTRLYARALTATGQAKQAVSLLEKQTRQHPEDHFLWQQLADSYGKANNILGVHEAQAEHYLLTGRVDEAVTQLKFALKLPNLPDPVRFRLQSRIEEAHRIKKSLEF